jgi:hypothetical protein
MRRRYILCASTAAAWAAVSGAAHGQTAPASPALLPRELASALPTAQAAGSARMRFLGLAIYDATLWVTPGFQAASYAQHPLALELRYLRSLSGRAIAERSLAEMRRAGPLEENTEQRWLAAMQAAFPDVKDGDRLTGLHTPGEGTRFWFNGQPRATVADAEFSRLFFGIWLADSTSEPRLRSALLAGLAP